MAASLLSWSALLHSPSHPPRHPYQPMSLGISPQLGVVAVGARDCPDNDASALFFFGLDQGRRIDEKAGLGQCALARSAASLENSFACTGWNKANGNTTAAGPAGYRHEFSGVPAMMTTTGISGHGDVSAFLWEEAPDEKHLNNRSGSLVLVQGGREVYHLDVQGQGSDDPQSVAISAGADARGRFTAAAVLGSVNKVVEYDPDTKRGTELWSKAGLEIDIAVSARGEAFAVTSGGGHTVDVYARSGAGFALLANIPAPNFAVQPATLAFDRADSSSPSILLSVAWTDAVGSQVIVTAHEIKEMKTVQQIWSYAPPNCSGGAQFDYVMQQGLGISGGGEVVAVGLWGCDGGPNESGQVVALKGRGGDGKALLLNATLPGEVWAVDVDVDVKTKSVYVGAGSWKSNNGSVPAQVTVYKWKLDDEDE